MWLLDSDEAPLSVGRAIPVFESERLAITDLLATAAPEFLYDGWAWFTTGVSLVPVSFFPFRFDERPELENSLLLAMEPT